MAPTNKNKRLRDNDQDLETDSNNKRSYNSCNSCPRFLVVESSSDDLPLSKLPPFAVEKGFQAVAGTLKSIKRLRDGSFLVECARNSQAMGLLKTTRFVDRPIRVSIHKALISSRGVIRCRELSGMTETEIKTELQEQGVVEVHRVMVKRDTGKVPTNTLFLTFNTPDLPKEITVGYLKVKVALLAPNPKYVRRANIRPFTNGLNVRSSGGPGSVSTGTQASSGKSRTVSADARVPCESAK